eukprot:scaffold77840_cov69-Phaeocystis_antarctica.AAC.5
MVSSGGRVLGATLTNARTYRCERCCRNSSRRSSGQQAIKVDRSSELNRLLEGERSGLARDPVQSLSQSLEAHHVRQKEPVPSAEVRGTTPEVSSACDSVWFKSNAWRSGGKRQSKACALCSTTACARLSYRTDTSACYWSMPAAGWIHGSSLCMLGVGSIAQQVVLPLAARSSLAAAVKYDAQD